MPSQPLGYGCDVESVGAGVLGDPGLGEEPGAGGVAGSGGVAGAGGATGVGDAAGAGGAVAGGTALVAPPPVGAGRAAPGSAGIVRLCFCASGMTKGPF